jgi:hypothetical protein
MMSKSTPDAVPSTPGRRSRGSLFPAIISESDPARFAGPQQSWSKTLSSLSFSFGVHALILFVLSWIYFDLPQPQVLNTLMTLIMDQNAPQGDDVAVELLSTAEPLIDTGESSSGMITILSDLAMPPDDETPLFHEGPTEFSAIGQATESRQQSVGPLSAAKPLKKSVRKAKGSTKTDPLAEMAGPQIDQFVGRKPKARLGRIQQLGGTDASEAAVAKGLEWLKNHQLADGSWNFDHTLHPRCNCSMPGRLDQNSNAATAMALMAFLGAGQTQEEGDYQPEVQQGLNFLLRNGMPADKGICFYGNLSGPQTFYTQGLVTIALSEASAMTGDTQLRPAITGAIEFLTATQDSGGGWRYFPGQPGDTSVVAWELMALKSAQFSRIPVPQRVFNGIDRFLSSVGSRRGSQYAYLPDRKDFPTPSMTAAGLLCRMYLDWEGNQGRLQAGVRALDEFGPQPYDMYYNYYATQVMHHWGGPEWDRWNKVMREYLIKTQIQEGHATGSWDVADRHGNAGGRLYMTTLALLTLEVYYRHLPLYQKDRIEIPLVGQPGEPKAP